MPEVVRQVRGVQRVAAQGFEKRVAHVARHAAEYVGGDAAEVGVVPALVRRPEEGNAARCPADGAVVDLVKLRLDESLSARRATALWISPYYPGDNGTQRAEAEI